MRRAVYSAKVFLLIVLTCWACFPWSNGATEEAAYDLGTGDRLRVTIHERPDLSHEYTVRSPGTLSVISIGEIPVVGMTLSELETMLSEKLGLKTQSGERWVNVEIAEFRPFFIVGDVKSPGRYPYAIGMTVLHAISLAGGFRVLDKQELSMRMEIVRLRSKLQELKQVLGSALASRARLISEYRELDSIDFSDELSSYFDDAALKEVMEREQRVFETQRETIASEVEALKRRKKVLRQEVRGNREELSAVSQEGKLIEDELQEYSAPERKNVVPRATIREFRRLAVRMKGEKRQLVASIASGEENIALIDQEIARLYKRRRLTVARDLKKIEETIAEATTQLGQAETSLFFAHAALPPTAIDPTPEHHVNITIVRRTAEGLEQFPASELTPVKPGDLIKVPARLPSMASNSGSTLARKEVLGRVNTAVNLNSGATQLRQLEAGPTFTTEPAEKSVGATD